MPAQGEDNTAAAEGLIRLASRYSAAETFTRLEAALESHGVHIFCHVDHSGEAAAVGLKMLPAYLVIFGNPRAGTPLMKESPTLAIDLPLKALVFEDSAGAVWLAWNDPAYLARRHGLASPVTLLRAVESFFREATGNPAP